MRDWLSASDLAALRLPGLPGTPNGWRDHAEREGWLASDKARLRDSRGGGLEFHIDLLPAAWRAAYVAKYLGAVAAPESDLAAADSEPDAAHLPARALEHRDARLAILAAADRLARDGNLSRGAADHLFVMQYRADASAFPDWVRNAVRKLSTATLTRWRRKKREGISRLGVDKGAARRGKGILEPAGDGKVARLVLGLRVANEHLSATHVKTVIEHEFPDLAGRFSLRNVQRLVAKIEDEDKALLVKQRDPDGYRNKFEMSGTMAEPERLNQRWQIDASPADILCLDGRWSIYACIDLYSRRTVIHVSRTPRAEAVTQLMRATILRWGVPEEVKTDNGSDFVARWTVKVLNDLGVDIIPSRAYNPAEKGHVERVIGTFQRDCAAVLPGFIGHSVTDRKKIEARKSFAQRLGLEDEKLYCVSLTGEQFQKICDDWAEGVYAHRVHSTIKCTPHEKAERYAGIVRRIDDPHALDLLVAPIAGGGGIRTVTKKGVRVDHHHYWTTIEPTTRVLVRMDAADIGRVILFSEDGFRYLGEGLCPDLAGLDPAATLAALKAERRELVAGRLAEARAEANRVRKMDVADIVIRQAAEKSGKLVELSKVSGLKREERYTTPALEAARAALDDARDYFFEPEPPPATDVARLPETPQMRFRRARELEARLARNERIDTNDAMWLGGYRQSNEYRALKEIHDDDADDASSSGVM